MAGKLLPKPAALSGCWLKLSTLTWRTFEQLCWAPESHDSHGNPPLHAVNECVFKEAGQSQGRLRSAFRVLQFLSDTQDAARDSGDGERHHGARLELAGAADMKKKPESYSAYQDRMFQELQYLSDFESHWKKEMWATVAAYGFVCGLTEEETRQIVMSWTPQMDAKQRIKTLDDEGKRKKKSAKSPATQL
jgi:hypothetical protein